MANVKISQLPTASAVTSDDFIPMVDSGSLTTQQVGFDKVLNYVTSSTFNTLTVTSLQGTSAEFNTITASDLTVQGVLTAREFHTELVSASIIYQSGSTKFGDTTDDTHQFTGSLNINGIISFSNIPVINTNNNPDDIYINSRIIRSTSTLFQDGMYIGYGNSGAANGHLRFYANGTNERMRIAANTGYVGIGVISPGELLDVRTTTATAGQGARIGEAKIGTWEGGTSYAAFVHNSVHATANSYALLQSDLGETVLNTASGRTLFFKNNNVTNMVIDSAGDVGIGTTSPGLKLEVVGDVIFGARNNWSQLRLGTLHITTDGGSTYSPRIEGASDNATSTYMRFYTSGNEAFRINPAGRVGIGHTSPDTLLDVRTSSGAAGQNARFGEMRVGTWQGSSVVAAIAHQNIFPTSTSYALKQTNKGQTDINTASGQYLYFKVADSAKMTIDPAGNVAVGLAIPTAGFNFDVSGSAKLGSTPSDSHQVTGSFDVSGSIRGDIEVSGSITATSYTLSVTDHGKTLLFSSSVAQDVTCSSGLSTGFNVTAVQLGTGQLNFSGSGVTLVNRFAHTSSAGQYSAVSVVVLNSTQYLLVGDTA